jgi:hypothetical protein
MEYGECGDVRWRDSFGALSPPSRHRSPEPFVRVTLACLRTFDHDDGSQYVNDTGNLLVFGGCKNYEGNSKSCDHNVILFPVSLAPPALLAAL